MKNIKKIEDAAKEYIMEAKNALDGGDYDLCHLFLGMAQDELDELFRASECGRVDEKDYS